MPQELDLIIKNGLVFDGLGNPGRNCNVGIRDGKIAEITPNDLAPGPATQVIDATGRWVTPGFIDMHTHYDAEVEVAPALSESLRFGVTTVVLGSCSIDFSFGTAEEIADLFCRVEALPYDQVRKILEERKTWNSLEDYLSHLNSLPLGPNIAALFGHSNLRAHVMGLERSLDRSVQPNESELREMERLLIRALDLGYIGLSVQTSRWDKMGGKKAYRSRPLPSAFARWKEYRRLTRILRQRGAIFQGVPNLTTRVNVFLFMLESASLWFRKRLKTTVISMMDVRSDRSVYRLIGFFSRFFNVLLGANFRWQSLPEVFDLWADGMDLVVFEEFGAGASALHLDDPSARRKLLRDSSYHQRFRKDWHRRFSPKAFHRDLGFSEILKAPDPSLVGKSFVQVAKERGQDPVDTFLDLMAEYGTALRWYTIMGNDREKPLQWILRHPDVLIGFSDAGAHLRNMAHYNYPLRMLRLVREAEAKGRPFMTAERAVQKLTSEIAHWLHLDAGVLMPGKRADIVVLDPATLDERVDAAFEAPMPGITPEYLRMVRRNPGVVKAVAVNGRLAVKDDEVLSEVGTTRGFGSFLRAGTAAREATFATGQ